MNDVGIVTIGRNEGPRLEACLRSCVGRTAGVVYVDSGSTDDSLALARRHGVEIVRLDLSIPFTAARARNEGIARLQSRWPAARYVQVLDGDCVLVEGWLEKARAAMEANPGWAVVCGRRRERFPQASIYNRLIDMEWNTPLGESKWCGGDAMIRMDLFQRVGGYNPALIAGEEPELCVRLRAAGGKIHRLDAEMTLHDAAITRFAQWWKRNVRSGHAYAEGCAMHGSPPERHFARDVRSNWLFGAVLPIAAMAAAWPTRGGSLLLLALSYGALFARMYLYARRIHLPGGGGWAWFTLMGKIPQAWGQAGYHLRRWSGKRAKLIEYKRPIAEKNGYADHHG